MDFFKSVFSEPTPSPSPPSSPTSANSPDSATPLSSWQFGSSIFQTLATKSESLLDNYYKDLQEFSSGLVKETSVIREVASRAVQDLPGRLESGAAIAHESLEAVGQAIDDVGSTVSEIISKDLNFAAHGNFSNLRLNEGDDSLASGGHDRDLSFGEDVKPYSRLEALIRGLQCDVRTYCDAIDDDDDGDFDEWRLGFNLEEKRAEIEKLMEENAVMREIYDEVVSRKVDEATFWCRYFYKVDKVVKAEEARLRIVKRAISGEDEEDLSWDVDEDDDSNNTTTTTNNTIEGKEMDKGVATVSGAKNDNEGLEERLRSNEKEGSDGKIGSDISIISSQRSSHIEDDIGWDEMEDIGLGDGNALDLRKKSSVAEHDEILAWDIEDDDS